MTYDTALEMVKSLEAADQRRLLQDLLKHLLGKAPRKGAAKGGAAGGPGGGGSWWTAATKKASAVLAPLRDAKNAELAAAGKKKLPGTVAVVILSKLKEAGKVTKEGAFPTDDELTEGFEAYVEDYEPEDAAKSTASKSSKASSDSKVSKSKFSELSPEEQKARRSEAAKKAAAARKANKAAKEAEADSSDEAAPAPAGKSTAVGGAGPAVAAEEPTFKERMIGKRKCLVMHIGSLTHVCDMEQNWLGVLKGTKVVKEGFSSPFEGDD
jgi:hypothetical protein